MISKGRRKQLKKANEERKRMKQTIETEGESPIVIESS
jgi:hypothetical protein